MTRGTHRILRLTRIDIGVYETADRRFRFCRHESDRAPKRWLIYQDDDVQPINHGQGHVSLREARQWLAQRILQGKP
jgi:hypothetical protein